jgi:hypothetical protein
MKWCFSFPLYKYANAVIICLVKLAMQIIGTNVPGFLGLVMDTAGITPFTLAGVARRKAKKI